jgi:hypothetical protein
VGVAPGPKPLGPLEDSLRARLKKLNEFELIHYRKMDFFAKPA